MQDLSMESWPAGPQPPIDAVREKVSECDVYIGILAWRYGSRTPDNISYIEYEYDLACNLNKPRLLFLRDKLCPVLPDDIDVNSLEIRRFRQKVENALCVRYFANELELVRAVSASLVPTIIVFYGAKISHREQVVLQLRGLTQDDLLARRQQLESPHSATKRDWFIPGMARCNVGRFYVPRESTLAAVTKWLVKTQSPYLFVTGKSGVGKTNFVLELIDCIGRTPSPLVQRAVFLFAVGEYDLSKSFVENIGACLLRQHSPLPILGRADTLMELVKDGEILLILDGLDEFVRLHSADECLPLFKSLKEHINPIRSRVIITCRDHIYKRLKSSAHLNPEWAESVPVDDLSEEEVRSALQNRLTRESSAYATIVANSSLLRIARRPLLLEMMCNINRESWKKLHLLPTEGKLYDLWFNEVITTTGNRLTAVTDELIDDTRVKVEKIAELMLDSRADVISEATLKGNGIPLERLQNLTCQPFGILIRETSEEWGFVHGSFREFALANKIAKELRTLEFDLLARTTKLDYVGAEPQMFLLGLFQSETELIEQLQQAMQIARQDCTKWDKVIWNIFETVGNIGTESAAGFIDTAVDVLSGALKCAPANRLSYRTVYNAVRCLERLHNSAPRPYYDHVITKEGWSRMATRQFFGAFAMRGFHVQQPVPGYFPPMSYRNTGENRKQQAVSDCLLILLKELGSHSREDEARYLEINSTFALIRWLHEGHVLRVKELLRDSNLTPESRGNLFQAFLRFDKPELFENCSSLFEEMTLAFCAISRNMVHPEFVFRKVRFKECIRSRIDGLNCDDCIFDD
jgi:hypothetical protein